MQLESRRVRRSAVIVAVATMAVGAGEAVAEIAGFNGGAGWTATDSSVLKFKRTYTGLDIAALVGGDSAYVGFTGGTGQNSNTQVVSDFTFAAGGAPLSINGGTGWSSTASVQPAPTFAASSVTLTNVNVQNRAASAFFNTRQSLGGAGGFEAQFTYQQTATVNPSAPGDGMMFVLQNSPQGASALGGAGGSLGYQGITPSFGVSLDVNQGAPRRDVTGLASGGNYNDNDGFPTAPVVLSSGRPIRVNLNYNGATKTLVQTLTDLSVVPPTFFSSNTLTLTRTNVQNQAASAFFNTPQVVDGAGGFRASFTYQQTSTANPSAPGDGVMFVLQNSPSGASALGGNGGSLGYQGITPSFAVALDVNQGAPRRDVTGLASGGQYNDNDGFPTAPVVLSSGDPIQVTLDYDSNAGTLLQTLVNLTSGATFSRTYTGLDISALVGGDTAYVGFTGGTGQNSNTQVISNFTFTPVIPEPASAGMMVAAAGGLLCVRRRQRA